MSVHLDIHEARAYGEGVLQVSIGNDRHGYRIAGPKFGAADSRLLKRITLTDRDAKEIGRYLSEIAEEAVDAA